MTSTSGKKLVIFTDLDGTLLDHDTYSYKAAMPAIERLRQQSIPLILTSSKTAAEIEPLREQLQLSAFPAIVENGAGILSQFEEPASNDAEYQALLIEIKRLGYDQWQGFADWSVEEVSKLTGLSKTGAELAKNRWYSEPGKWLGSQADFNNFISALDKKGIVANQGGRFWALSYGGSKELALDKVKNLLTSQLGPVFTIALGDGANDIGMIRKADMGIVIPNPHHEGIRSLPEEKNGNVRRAVSVGPVGWNEEILKVLDRHGSTNG